MVEIHRHGIVFHFQDGGVDDVAVAPDHRQDAAGFHQFLADDPLDGESAFRKVRPLLFVIGAVTVFGADGEREGRTLLQPF